jgi:hypothetical protein
LSASLADRTPEWIKEMDLTGYRPSHTTSPIGTSIGVTPGPLVRCREDARAYNNRYISVLSIVDRKVAHWRDYLDLLAVFDAVGWPATGNG